MAFKVTPLPGTQERIKEALAIYKKANIYRYTNRGRYLSYINEFYKSEAQRRIGIAAKVNRSATMQEAVLVGAAPKPQNKTEKISKAPFVKSILWTLPGTYWYYDNARKTGAVVDEGRRRELIAPPYPRSKKPFELGKTIWKLWDREVFKMLGGAPLLYEVDER